MTGFTSNIMKVGAHLSDTRVLLDAWDHDLSTDDNVERIVDNNLLGLPSQSRAHDVMVRALRPRFIAPDAGIIEALGVATKDEVLSPTFSLIHEYEGDPKVYHIDLYRLDRVPELETLGLEDFWEQDAIVIIEWGEKFDQQLPGRRTEIHLRHNDDDTRTIEVNTS